MSPTVSVIIPTFNRAEYITHTVESVLNQTFPGYELIVVDDGSTDDTGRRLEPFVPLPNFRYHRQPNRGRSVARNRGVELARGGLLMFLDSDDLLLPEALDLLCGAAARRPSAGMVVGQTEFVDDRLRSLRVLSPAPESSPGGLAYQDLIRAPFSLLPGAYVVRGEVLKEVGAFDPLSEPCEDFDFAMRVALRREAAYVARVVVRHRMHGGNTPEDNIHLGSLKVARKHFNLVEGAADLPAALRRRSLINWVVKAGDNHYGLGENFQALKHYLRALALDPGGLADPHLRRQTLASLVPVSVRERIRNLRSAG